MCMGHGLYAQQTKQMLWYANKGNNVNGFGCEFGMKDGGIPCPYDFSCELQDRYYLIFLIPNARLSSQ